MRLYIYFESIITPSNQKYLYAEKFARFSFNTIIHQDYGNETTNLKHFMLKSSYSEALDKIIQMVI